MRSIVGLLLAAVALVPCLALNSRPIIGILTLPNYLGSISPEFEGTSYFPASYVKFVEMGGARVVAVPFDQDAQSLKAQLANLNGVLFTGGGADFYYPNGTLTPFAASAQIIWDEMVAAAGVGDTFPVWGTCLGFELLSFLASGSNTEEPVIVPGFDSENLTLPLNFTEAAKTSRMYSTALSDSLFNTFADEDATSNMHGDGLPPANFESNVNMTSRLTVLSTNKDRNGRTFVSSWEGNTLPVYATQYHPEKPIFTWWAEQAEDHSYDSIRANSALSQFFVNQARLSNRHYPTIDDENAAVIYNHNPVPCLEASPEFMQCYFFTPSSQ